MTGQDLDRHHPATPYKLRRARERGQAARSADLTSALVFAAAIGYLSWHGVDAVATQLRVDLALLRHAGRTDPMGASLWPLIAHALRATLEDLAPFFAALMLAAIVGNMVQTGPMLSFHPLKADLGRIHPANGLRRLFSMRVLFDAARALVKLAVLGLVAFLALEALAGQFHVLAALPPIAHLHLLLGDLASLGLRMALALGMVALLDLAYVRREFARRMRMSQRELKDEVRHREGDPRIRARMRELRRETRRRSLALRRTSKADVLITNPTHLAVALKYEHGRMAAPQLLAKGAGQLAAAMREIAARHRIPVVQDPPLARRLFHELQVDHLVPPALHAQVARIIVWVFAMRECRQGRTAAGAHS